MTAVNTTVIQKVVVPKRIVASSVKSGVKKNKYTTIHKSITTLDPTTTIQVILVQLKKASSKQFNTRYSQLTNAYSTQHKY
jgi:hypothetical protein